jgi:hypothetical protein
MPDRPAANNATTFKLAILAMLLSVWLIGRSSDPDAPLPPTVDELLESRVARIKSVTGDPAARDGAEPHATPMRPDQLGRVHGIVLFVGERPEAKTLDLNSDPYCQAFYEGKPSPRSERWVINADGALANVLVHVAGGLPDRAWSPPAEARIVRIEGCRFVPHVTAMMLGQWVEFHNHDQTMHSIHMNPAINPQRGVEQPWATGTVLTRWQPTRPEIGILTRCDAHAMMGCQLHILPHPFFALTNTQGEFEIINLPPGEYELAATHEVKAAKAVLTPAKVKVEAGKATQVLIEVTAN